MPKRFNYPTPSSSRSNKRRFTSAAGANLRLYTNAGRGILKGTRLLRKVFKKWRSRSNKNTNPKVSKIIRDPPAGLSTSFTKQIFKRKRFIIDLIKANTNSIYKFNETFNVSCTPGTQSSGNVSSPYWGLSAITGLVTQGLTVVTQPTLPTTKIQDFKILLKSVTANLVLTNEAPGACEIDIWDLICNCSTSSYATPTSQWVQGLVDEEGPATDTVNMLYSIPTMTKRFNLNWKVIKRTRLELGAGRSHRHTCYYRPNIIIDSQYANTFQMIKGVTRAIMVTVKGLPSDTSNTYTVGTVTTGRIKVVGIHDVKYDSCMISSQPKNINFQNTIGTSDVYEFNEGAGTENLATAASTNFG